MLKQLSSAMLILVLLAGILPQNLWAADHVITPAELERALVDQAQARQLQIDRINTFFSTEVARQALQSASIDPQKVEQAVASLSDAELAQLTAKATQVQNDFVAGQLTGGQLVIIIVVLAVVLIIAIAA
jgi:hypothetical protein